ncbi:hypothetical protein JYA63_07250 [Fictibacillus nanhaiensis]|uniref:Glycosyltransferase 2-like domain-containing protein n=1 Tax=Fictibacillus nanhaiensis TaxID=742169 RepID=A0ABS2ZRU1_9BACL|nr:hypothetical protein [Fictibacillus nanhaiensis]
MSLLLQLESKLLPTVTDLEKDRLRTNVIDPLIELLYIGNNKNLRIFNDDLLLADPETLKILIDDFLEKKSFSDEEINVLSNMSRTLNNKNGFESITESIDEKLFNIQYSYKRQQVTSLVSDITKILKNLTGNLTHVIELWEKSLDELIKENINNENPNIYLESIKLKLSLLENSIDNFSNSDDILRECLDYSSVNQAVKKSWKKIINVTQRSQKNKNLDLKWDSLWEKLDEVGLKSGVPLEKNQKVLITAYHLIFNHLNDFAEAKEIIWDPKVRWGSCEKGRKLLHFISDKLTGYKGLKPVMDFDDKTLIKFCKAISKANKHKFVNNLHHLGFITSIKMAKSKIAMNEVNRLTKIEIIVPMGNEGNRILDPLENPMGQNALRTKLFQVDWLFADNPDIEIKITFVDDGDPTGSGKVAESILSNEFSCNYNSDQTGMYRIYYLQECINKNLKFNIEKQNPVLVGLNDAENDSVKGGSTIWGLYEAAKAGTDIVLFSDFDLTYPLEEAGLLISKLLSERNLGVTIGSRRLDDSYGYYLEEGPNVTAMLYAKAVKELLNLNFINDPQAGFKAVKGSLLLEILPNMRDRSLSFDTELLLLSSLAGFKISEVGVSTLHKYEQDNMGVQRNYEEMLETVESQAKWHGQKSLIKKKSIKFIKENGGFNKAVFVLEEQKLKSLTGNKEIEIVDIKQYS